MITVKLLGGAKKSFGLDPILADLHNATIRQLLDYLVSIKPQDTPELDVKNVLIAVNGADSSAMDGHDTVLCDGDVVSIIPVIHGGAPRARFRVRNKSVEVFYVSHKKGENYSLLGSIRRKFPRLIVEGVSAQYVLSASHAKKIVGLSLFAQKNDLLLSKKLETDMLLRFAATKQISDAMNAVGIESANDFVVIAIGAKSAQDSLHGFLKPYLGSVPDRLNSAFLQKHFGISNRHLSAAVSERPLEDLLVERAAVLFH